MVANNKEDKLSGQEKKAIEQFVRTFSLIYTVSFTGCVAECVKAINSTRSCLVALACLVLLSVAFRFIFATKALGDKLDNLPINSKGVILFHSPALIIQAGLIFAASIMINHEPPDIRTAMVYISCGVLLNGVWLLILDHRKLWKWALNNITFSILVLFVPPKYSEMWYSILPLGLNSVIDFSVTSDWYLGLEKRMEPRIKSNVS